MGRSFPERINIRMGKMSDKNEKKIDNMPQEDKSEPMKKNKTPQGKEKKKKKQKEVKVGASSIDVLPSTDDGTIGINSNRGRAVVNLANIDTIMRMSGGSIIPGQKHSFAKLSYILPVGENVPTTGGETKDPRPISIGAKGHKVKFTNMSRQTLWLSVMRPLAAEHDAATLGFMQEKATDFVLEPDKSFIVNLKKDFDSPLESYVDRGLYVENILWFHAYRTDQLDDTLLGADHLPNYNADMLDVEMESTYYGEPAATVEGLFHAIEFFAALPTVTKRDMGVKKARGSRIKFGKNFGWVRNNKSNRLLTIDYDVHQLGRGLGFDFANYDDAELGWKSYLVLAYANEGTKPWTRVRTDSWKQYILCINAAGGLNYKQYGELGMNLGGGLCKWSAAHDGFVMWDFARDTAAYIDYGYGTGYAKFRRGRLPSRGQIQVMETGNDVKETAAWLPLFIAGLGLVEQIIKLTLKVIDNVNQSQGYVASVKRLALHGADPLKDEATRIKHESSTLHPRPQPPAEEFAIIQDKTAWLATEYEKVAPPGGDDGGHPAGSDSEHSQ